MQALLGIMSFLLAWVVQSFFASVLLNIVDVVFVCYAMDRDTQVWLSCPSSVHGRPSLLIFHLCVEPQFICNYQCHAVRHATIVTLDGLWMLFNGIV